MNKKIKLSILMLVYQNEEVEAYIKNIHEKVVKQFQKLKLGDVEIIIAEDGSKDNTRKILKSIQKKYNLTLNLCDQRRGYIKAAKEVYMQARGDYIFYTDGDGEHEPADFWRLWNKMHDKKLDLVIGYKTQRKPFYRAYIARVNTIFMGVLFNVWLKDPDCGFRVMKNNFAKKTIPLANNMSIAWNSEIPLHAKVMGYRYSEVPVKHFPQISDVFPIKKLPMKTLKAVLEIFKFRSRVSNIHNKGGSGQ